MKLRILPTMYERMKQRQAEALRKRFKREYPMGKEDWKVIARFTGNTQGSYTDPIFAHQEE